MRRQLLRSSRRLAQANAVKQQQTNAFSTTTRRPAEVELTVDGKKVSIEGTCCGSVLETGNISEADRWIQPAQHSSKHARKQA